MDHLVFLEDISQTIVKNTTDIIGFPISITDEKGYIIGSNDPLRIGSYHQASIDVLKRKETICYEISEVKNLKNVLPGVATPIIINNEAIGVLGIVGDPSEVKKYAQLVKSHVELMCHEHMKKEMSILESKTFDNLIHYLLNLKSTEDSDYIVRYGKMLGFNLDSDVKRICFLIEIDFLSDPSSNQQDPEGSSWQFLQNHIIALLRYYFIDSQEDLISLLTLDQFIVIKSINHDCQTDSFIKRMENKILRFKQFLKSKHNVTASISIGSIHSGLEGIQKSYHDSLQALTAGKKTTISPEIYHYNDWNIMLELLGEAFSPYVAERFADKIGHFFNYANYPTLSSTFMTYCRCNMNLSETARILFLHRNSLVYRLEKIKELTTLDFAKFEHCLLLYFAIKNSETDEKSPILQEDDKEGIFYN